MNACIVRHTVFCKPAVSGDAKHSFLLAKVDLTSFANLAGVAVLNGIEDDSIAWLEQAELRRYSANFRHFAGELMPQDQRPFTIGCLKRARAKIVCNI
jgi:hypothetical protein